MDGIKNAVIERTSFGMEGAGLSFWVTLNYGNSSVQGFGSYSLDHAPKDRNFRMSRRPSILAGATIKGILEAVGVELWEDLKGKNVRAVVEGGTIKGIGHILEDKWFRFDRLYDVLKESVEAEIENIPNFAYTTESPAAEIIATSAA